MDIKELGFAGLMMLSALILTNQWLSRLGNTDGVIILSAVVLVGSLAAMLISVETRIQNIEAALESRERFYRVSLKSVEENLEKKIEAVSSTVRSINEASRRSYR